MKKTVISEFLGYFAWITLACLAFILGRGCAPEPIVSKSEVDSAISAAKTWQVKYEQQVRDNARSNEVISDLWKIHDSQTEKLEQAKAEAGIWRTKFSQAKEVHDTVTMIAACDSALPKYEEALGLAEARHRTDSLIIGEKDKRISADSVLLSQANALIKKQGDLNSELIAKVNAQEKRAKRGKVWRWLERAALVAGTAFVLSR